MFKKFIRWFFGITFWRNATKFGKARFIAAYVVSYGYLTYLVWTSLEDRRLRKKHSSENFEDPEPDIFTTD